MSKNHKKDKKAKGKDKQDAKAKNAKPATLEGQPKPEKLAAVGGILGDAVETAGATYSDGHPQDRVQYLEAKLILKPDRFISVDSFRDFGKLVQRTAKNLKVGFITDPKVGRRPDIREIVFMDTPDFRLYNNAFILRRRIAYVDGFPVGDPEIVFKFRHPDEKTAAAMDVRPNIAGDYQIKFKAEALPLKDQFRRLSHFVLAQLRIRLEPDAPGQTAWVCGALASVFPALAVLKKSEDEEVSLVNEAIVEEVLLELGNLDFGKGVDRPLQRSLMAHPRRTHSAGGRVCVPGQVQSRRRIAHQAQKAVRAVLHHAAAGREGLDFVGHHQDGNGLSPEGQSAAKS